MIGSEEFRVRVEPVDLAACAGRVMGEEGGKLTLPLNRLTTVVGRLSEDRVVDG